MRAIILCMCLVVSAIAQDTPQRVVGPPHCTLDSQSKTLSMRFVTRLEDDAITTILGIRYNAANDLFSIGTCAFDTIIIPDGETGAGTYFVLEATLLLDGATDANSDNPCGFVQSMTLGGNNKFSWLLALREEAGFQHDIDRDYAFSCLEETATNTYVWTSLQVKHDELNQTLVTTTPNVIMQVLTKNALTGDFEPTTSCIVGEDVKLELVYDIVDYVDYLKFWGLYSYDTNVAKSDTSITMHNLIGGDGCKQDGNILGLEGGFTREAFSNADMFKARTGIFECRRFWDSFDLYFTTHVKFCAGVIGQDNKCYDFCATNQGNGRRRRQAVDNEEFKVSIHLTVLEAADGKETQKNDGLSQNVIIAVTATAGVVLIVVVIATLFFCLRSRRYDAHDSRASSERSLPVKF